MLESCPKKFSWFDLQVQYPWEKMYYLSTIPIEMHGLDSIPLVEDVSIT